MEKDQFELLYNEISSLRQVVNEIADYLKYRDGREISFHLNCINSGLDDRETSSLFLFYSNETENKSLSELESLIENPDNLIERSRIFIDKLENTHEESIKTIIKAFVYNYAMKNINDELKIE
ncbi:MAG: hypothetical protein Q3988_06170 [Gemella sp.]|nr:hypothetical protein [Gemella sp.]